MPKSNSSYRQQTTQNDPSPRVFTAILGIVVFLSLFVSGCEEAGLNDESGGGDTGVSRLSSVTYTMPESSAGNTHVFSYTYEGDADVPASVVRTTEGSATELSWAFTYDAEGKRTKVRHSETGAGEDTFSFTYGSTTFLSRSLRWAPYYHRYFTEPGQTAYLMWALHDLADWTERTIAWEAGESATVTQTFDDHGLLTRDVSDNTYTYEFNDEGMPVKRFQNGSTTDYLAFAYDGAVHEDQGRCA